MKTIFCFGLGYTGTWLRHQLQGSDWQVNSCRRADFNDSSHEADIMAADTLICSVPPNREAPHDPAITRWQHIIRDSNARQIIYLSTTGVYTEKLGNWVDEQAAVDPHNARVLAEHAWQQLGKPVVSLRLAGIYGPAIEDHTARGQVQSFRQSTISQRIEAPGQVFNRIHVADIVQVIIALLHRPVTNHKIYNIADGVPASQRVTVDYIARLFGTAPPPLRPLKEAELSPMGRGFYQSNKRVDSRAVQRDLGVHWQYPSYREGFKSLV